MINTWLISSSATYQRWNMLTAPGPPPTKQSSGRTSLFPPSTLTSSTSIVSPLVRRPRTGPFGTPRAFALATSNFPLRSGAWQIYTISVSTFSGEARGIAKRVSARAALSVPSRFNNGEQRVVEPGEGGVYCSRFPNMSPTTLFIQYGSNAGESEDGRKNGGVGSNGRPLSNVADGGIAEEVASTELVGEGRRAMARTVMLGVWKTCLASPGTTSGGKEKGSMLSWSLLVSERSGARAGPA